MAITIIPNTLCIPSSKESHFHLFSNSIDVYFSSIVYPSYVVLKARVSHIKNLSVVFGDCCFKPFIVFEFLHKPSNFDCKVVEKTILVSLKPAFSKLEQPNTVVKARIDRDLTKNCTLSTRRQIKRGILNLYTAKEKHTIEEEKEVLPLLDDLNEENRKNLFYNFRFYSSCTAFIKKMIYNKPHPFFDEVIETHFKKNVCVTSSNSTEYTTACLEYFILRKAPIYLKIAIEEPQDLSYYFNYKYIDLLTTAEDPLKIVQAKYDYTTDISSYPVWLQVHFLKEYLSAPNILEGEKESCLFYLLTIYLDLKMELCESLHDLRKLVIARSLLPKRVLFTSDEGAKISAWIIEIIQNLHNNEYWSSALRQKVCEISDLLDLKWMFPDTYRESYYPALYEEAKKLVLPFCPVAELMQGKVLFRFQREIFHYPLNVTYKDYIVSFNEAINTFIDSHKKVLFIEGPRGSGKTASILNYADDALLAYSNNESYIPFFHDKKELTFPEDLNPASKELLKSIPFLFIFDELTSLDEIPYLKEWMELFPKAKYILITRNKIGFDNEHDRFQMLPIQPDQIPTFYKKMSEGTPTRFTPEIYTNAALKIPNPSLLHIHLLTKLSSRRMRSNHLEDTMQSLDLEWDKSKNPNPKETNDTSSLAPIIKWFRKLNR